MKVTRAGIHYDMPEELTTVTDDEREQIIGDQRLADEENNRPALAATMRSPACSLQKKQDD